MEHSNLTLYHNNPSIITLSDYMEAFDIKGISVDDLFAYEYREGITNRYLIYSQMSPQEKADYAVKIGKTEKDPPLDAKDLKSDMKLPCPCFFKIEAKYVTRELAISQTNFQENIHDFYAFESSLIQRILGDGGYEIDSATKKKAPTCSVWGWFKSLYYSGTTFLGEHFQSKNNTFVEISDFVLDLSTHVTKSGGTFSITLPIIHATPKKELVVAGEGIASMNGMKIPQIDFYENRFVEQAEVFLYNRYSGDGKKKHFFHKVGLSSMEENYFNWLIQSNDLIFISFEDLQMERGGAPKVFDMIGLVESVSMTTDGSGNGVIRVSGKDLMKLISDDNSLFFNTSSASGPSQLFSNTESLGKQGDIREADMLSGMSQGPENRLRRNTNEIDIFAVPFNRTINFVLKGVISQLANIEIVPDYVFNSWGDTRTRFNDWLILKEVDDVSGGDVTSAEETNDAYDDAENSNAEFSVFGNDLTSRPIRKFEEFEKDYGSGSSRIPQQQQPLQLPNKLNM